MEFSEVINKRRSVRKYTSKPVPPEVIRQGLDQALLAPNTSNIQPWEFYWVRSTDKKAKLIEACYGQPAAATAQELVVAVANMKTWNRNRLQMLEILKSKEGMPKKAFSYYEKLIPMIYRQGPLSLIGLLKRIMFWFGGWAKPVPRGPHSYSELRESLVKTVALACENFMLSMFDQGFGSCPMEGFDEHRVRKALGLKRSQRVVMVMSAGEPDPTGIWGERIRLDEKQFLFEV